MRPVFGITPPTGHRVDYVPGATERVEAIARVEVKSGPWRAVALDAMRAVCAVQDSVTSDDVWYQLDRMGIARPEEGRAMGSVMRQGFRDGLIRPTPRFVQGTQPGHHRDLMRVWSEVR